MKIITYKKMFYFCYFIIFCTLTQHEENVLFHFKNYSFKLHFKVIYLKTLK